MEIKRFLYAIALQHQGCLLQRLAPEFQAVNVPNTIAQATMLIRSSFYDQIPVLEHLLEQTANEISNKVGLFCVSNRFDSLPMWAHYAANASGLVIEFIGLDKVFTGDDTGILRVPINVRYEREKSGVTFEPRSHESLFFDKFQDWSYEQEIRVVMPLKECNIVQFKDRKLYLYDIPVECVSQLILGWRMDEATANDIDRQASKVTHGVKVTTAKISRGRVVLGNNT
jgi:hypothetical protein